MQFVVSGNRILAHGENSFIAMGGTVICKETNKTYQNATIVTCEICPADIDSVGYEYHAGSFIPCAPYGKGDGNGTVMVADAECKTPKDTGVKFKQVKLSRIGDVQYTIRTDLGDDWLLCDGGPVRRSQYPELVDLLPPSEFSTITGYANGSWINTNQLIGCRRGAHGDGMHAFTARSSYNSGGTFYYYPVVMYSQTGKEGDWAQIQLYAGSASVYAIHYHGGYWVAVGAIGENAAVYTATDPAGPWTATKISGAAAEVLYDVHCDNGTWIAVGTAPYSSSGSPYVYVATDPTGTWTEADPGTGHYARAVHCEDGVWVVAMDHYSGSTSEVSVSTDFGKTWTETKISGIADIGNVFCHDGIWAVSGIDASKYPCVAVSRTPEIADSWTVHTVSTSLALSLPDHYNGAYLTHFDGKWTIVGNPQSTSYEVFLFTADAPDGTWEVSYATGSPAIKSTGGFIHLGDILMMCSYDTGDIYQFYSSDVRLLPTLDNAGVVKGYIKATED